MVVLFEGAAYGTALRAVPSRALNQFVGRTMSADALQVEGLLGFVIVVGAQGSMSAPDEWGKEAVPKTGIPLAPSGRKAGRVRLVRQH